MGGQQSLKEQLHEKTQIQCICINNSNDNGSFGIERISAVHFASKVWGVVSAAGSNNSHNKSWALSCPKVSLLLAEDTQEIVAGGTRDPFHFACASPSPFHFRGWEMLNTKSVCRQLQECSGWPDFPWRIPLSPWRLSFRVWRSLFASENSKFFLALLQGALWHMLSNSN